MIFTLSDLTVSVIYVKGKYDLFSVFGLFSLKRSYLSGGSARLPLLAFSSWNLRSPRTFDKAGKCMSHLGLFKAVLDFLHIRSVYLTDSYLQRNVIVEKCTWTKKPTEFCDLLSVRSGSCPREQWKHQYGDYHIHVVGINNTKMDDFGGAKFI